MGPGDPWGPSFALWNVKINAAPTAIITVRINYTIGEITKAPNLNLTTNVIFIFKLKK